MDARGDLTANGRKREIESPHQTEGLEPGDGFRVRHPLEGLAHDVLERRDDALLDALVEEGEVVGAAREQLGEHALHERLGEVRVVLTVRDDGPGLPPDFDLVCDEFNNYLMFPKGRQVADLKEQLLRGL